MTWDKLENIIEIKKGKKPIFSDTPNSNSSRVLQIDDLRNDDNIKYTDDKSGVFAFEDDVLIAWDGANAGTIGYGKTGFIGSTIARLRKKTEGVFYTAYLGGFLQSKSNLLRQKATGATIPHINGRMLRDLKIPLPPFLDQIKISKLLSKVENLIAKRKKSIALLEEFLKSTFLELFGDPVKNEKGWALKKIIEITTNENSKRIPIKQSDRDNREGKYSYYGATGIIDTIDDFRFNGEYLLIAEDGKNLLYRRKNNAFIARGKFWVNNHAHVLAYNGKANLRYLEFHLNSIDLSPYITGTDQIKLNKENLDRIPVPIPPVPLQTQFVQIVETIEVLKSKYQSSLQELQKLFGILSQQAFRGELDLSKIQLTNDEEYSATANVRTEPKPVENKKEAKKYKVDAKIETTKQALWKMRSVLGKAKNIPFNNIEGDAVFRKVFSKKTKGFGFDEFEGFIKTEGFTYEYQQLKDFIFGKLESKELIQFYSNAAWREKTYKEMLTPIQDDFAGDGKIYLVPKEIKK